MSEREAAEQTMRLVADALGDTLDAHVTVIVDMRDCTLAVLPEGPHPRETVELLVQIAFDYAAQHIGTDKAGKYIVEVLAQAMAKRTDTSAAAAATDAIIARMKQ